MTVESRPLADDVWPPAPSGAELSALFEAQTRRREVDPNPSYATRLAWLESLEAAVRGHRRELWAALARDLHRAPEESEFGDLIPTLHELRFARRNLRRWMRPQHVPTPRKLFGASSEVRHEPKGVVLVLAPWNYPVYLSLAPLAGALAAGNRAIVRPSEKAPHSAAVLAAIVREAFAPEDVALVRGEVETAQRLLELPFDHIFFTGSANVGKQVLRAAAERLTSVTLELGGKSPALVAPDADLEVAAARIAWGKFLNAGQTCVAPDYVLVHELQAQALVSGLVAAVEKMYGASEDARARSAGFARLVDEAAFDRLERLLDATLAGGARMVLGGRRNRAERYIAPTILTGLDFDAPLMSEEIFGPLLPVLTYRSLDEAIAKINRGAKPLALYVFGSAATADAVIRRTSAGGTAVNDTIVQLANENLPFGGAGESGMGNYHGVYGFRTFSHERAIFHQAKRSALGLLYPPFGPVARVLLKLLDRYL
jgi:aldehyde dehydrogenase (NAD+)